MLTVLFLWKGDWPWKVMYLWRLLAFVVFLCIIPAFLHTLCTLLTALYLWHIWTVGWHLWLSLVMLFSLDFGLNFEMGNLFFWHIPWLTNYAVCLIFWICAIVTLCISYFICKHISIPLCEPRVVLWFAERENKLIPTSRF